MYGEIYFTTPPEFGDITLMQVLWIFYVNAAHTLTYSYRAIHAHIQMYIQVMYITHVS